MNVLEARSDERVRWHLKTDWRASYEFGVTETLKHCERGRALHL